MAQNNRRRPAGKTAAARAKPARARKGGAAARNDKAVKSAARPPSAPGRFARWRRRIVLAVLALVFMPTLVILAYGQIGPPLTPLMAIRWVEGDGADYRWRPLDSFPDALPRAVIAAEDNLFCRHNGFDAGALRAQVERALAGERPRGASTISMQTAKNILLWPGRDMLRKGLEVALTPQLELFWDKRRIIEIYLNIAEWGPGIFGAEAAAQHWFGKPASALAAGEAARLAAILPSPRNWPADGAYAGERSKVLLRRMKEIGSLYDCLDS